MQNSPVTAFEDRAFFTLKDAHPRHWGAWLLVFLAFSVTKLPYDWQMTIGRMVGRLLFRFGQSRRNIVTCNIHMTHPQWSAEQVCTLAKAHFESLGMGFMETAFAWWGDIAKLEGRMTFVNSQSMDEAWAKGQGVMAWFPHITNIDLAGRMIITRYPMVGVYSKNPNPWLDTLIKRNREKHMQGTINHKSIKLMVKALKQNAIVWYSSDQKYRGKGFEVVDLMGVPAPSNPATSRLGKISGAPCIMCMTHRQTNAQGQTHYQIEFIPLSPPYPADDPKADIAQIHGVLEAYTDKNPADFYWVHNRWHLEKNQIEALAIACQKS